MLYITVVWLPTCTKLFLGTSREPKWMSAKMLNHETLYTPPTLEKVGDRGALGRRVHVTVPLCPREGKLSSTGRLLIHFFWCFEYAPLNCYTFWSSELRWNSFGPISRGSKQQLTLLVVITTSYLYLSYALGCGPPLLRPTGMSMLNSIHLWGTVFHKSWLFSPWVCSARNQILFFFFSHQDRAHLIGSVIINKDLLILSF